jgi:hypothetical protein
MKIRSSISAAGVALATSLLVAAVPVALAQDAPEKAQAEKAKVMAEAQAKLEQLLGQVDPGSMQLQVTAGRGGLMTTLGWETPQISGHPYSAVAREVTYSPDGAHVDRSNSENISRDDQGRTRRETNNGKQVTIIDPAAGITYNLDVEHKVAMKRTMAPAAVTALANQRSIPDQSPLEIATAQAARRPNMTVEDLGTQVVNGVSAQGVRVTTTTPVGAFGNDRELKTVVERWVSPDLHVLVKSVTTDSRSGSVKYELTNLTLSAPDSSQFQPPAGYTVQEGGRGARGRTLMPVQVQGGRK